ncbi:MAG: DNA ligase LigA-related protein [Sarcina sp.]
MQEFSETFTLESKINFLQRKIILNSILYYEHNLNLISDLFYDGMCNQLVELQDEYIYLGYDILDTTYGYIYYDFDGSTGYHLYSRLNLEDMNWLNNIVNVRLIKEREKPRGNKMKNIKNDFPGYEYINGKNMYRGDDVGRGGYVYSEPGMYTNVALIDVVSMHPNSLINMNLFGDEYTKKFSDLVNARIAIKNGDYELAKTLFDGRLAPYLDDPTKAKELGTALKIPINSVYGLTSASFDNVFKDKRNVNNIVALRGALFMRTLQDEVQARGYKVAHIKTDSIKIPDATPEIIDFVNEFGRTYGYEFDHEATYDKMCLVNDAVYIAKYQTAEECAKLYGYIPGDNKKKGDQWTATGTQFQIPYVFKTMFSKEPIEFEDLTVTKTVTSSLYLDLNESIINDIGDDTVFVKALDKGIKKGTLSQTELGELEGEIERRHNYKFVGKIGNFVPIKSGYGGGELCREKDGKYYSATGAKGYRWIESEIYTETTHEEDIIDYGYFISLVDDARDSISKYGDIDWFVL